MDMNAMMQGVLSPRRTLSRMTKDRRKRPDQLEAFPENRQILSVSSTLPTKSLALAHSFSYFTHAYTQHKRMQAHKHAEYDKWVPKCSDTENNINIQTLSVSSDFALTQRQGCII